MSGSIVRTEVRGLDLCLEDDSLGLSASGENLIWISLPASDAERLRLEFAKVQLWEWNQLEEVKSRAELRYRRYLGSWLVMCLAAFSAYIGYPSFYLCIGLSLLSIFLWWRAGLAEQKAAEEAEAQRRAFRLDWNYIQGRQGESDESSGS